MASTKGFLVGALPVHCSYPLGQQPLWATQPSRLTGHRSRRTLLGCHSTDAASSTVSHYMGVWSKQTEDQTQVRRLKSGFVHTREDGEELCIHPRVWRKALARLEQLGSCIIGACHLGERAKNKKLSDMRKRLRST